MFVRKFNNSERPRVKPTNLPRETYGSKGCRDWTSLEIMEVVKDDKLRLSDNPDTINLAGQLLNTPDVYLNELFTLTVNQEIAKATMDDDGFRENYPPAGSVQMTAGCIICGLMPTDDPVVLIPDRLFCNMGVFGRTGSGKSSWIYLLIKQLLVNGPIDANI